METKDLTRGGIMRNLTGFALPYLLTYFMQILYGMTDLYVIGRYCGVESITAVSIGSQVMHGLTVVIIGLAMGTTVVVGQAVGAGLRSGRDDGHAGTGDRRSGSDDGPAGRGGGNARHDDTCAGHDGGRAGGKAGRGSGKAPARPGRTTSAVVGNTISLFLLFAIVTMVVLLATVGGLVGLIKTPAEAVEGTEAYLAICFTGIPFIVAYNIIASIFRGLGDTRRPMHFVAIACVANVALDVLLVGVMGMDVAGAALATTAAQALSVVCAIVMIRRRHIIEVQRADLRPRREAMGAILSVGIPVALQDGFIQVAFIIITVIANMRGLTDAAAVGIVEKVIGALFLVPSAMLSAVSAIGAQNVGAGELGRARRTLWYAMGVTVAYGVGLSLVMQVAAEGVVGLFTADAGVVEAGGQYLRAYIWDTALAGMHFCFTGFFCAHGLSVISFVHNLAAVVVARVPLSYALSVAYPTTLYPMGIATPLGSLVSVVICAVCFVWLRRRGRA